ncbi:hypothetical protein KIN20_023078 [Parelaphostrongylus tenuis]|uniref:Uncharacterized protein n=1 Tax=Parelaphostrongylus tenuis TaxID=148309 RepID=A0AAD5QX52_PARTN|nr:hypothetical protein KIN20_023078 [Parelaphostrongylus tenuis]
MKSQCVSTPLEPAIRRCSAGRIGQRLAPTLAIPSYPRSVEEIHGTVLIEAESPQLFSPSYSQQPRDCS